MKSKAIFLDRDGVLIKDKNLITNLQEVELLPDVGDAISLFKEMGFKIFLITNQTVVARGMMSLTQMYDLNQAILEQVKAQNSYASFDDVFVCPHHPNATIKEFRKDCECRKPRSGMILEAQKKYNLDLAKSIVIGDRATDIYSGKSVGCYGIQLATGEQDSPLIESSLKLEKKFLVPDQFLQSLLEAAFFLSAGGHES